MVLVVRAEPQALGEQGRAEGSAEAEAQARAIPRAGSSSCPQRAEQLQQHTGLQGRAFPRQSKAAGVAGSELLSQLQSHLSQRQKGILGNAKACRELVEELLPVDGDQHSRADVLTLWGFHRGKEA